MNLWIRESLFALALAGLAAHAEAAQTILHNDLDGDGRSDLIWRNAATGAVVYWPGADWRHPVEVQVIRTYDMPGGFSLARSPIAFAYGGWSVSRADLLARDDSGILVGMMLEASPGGYVAYRDGAVSPDWRLVGAGDFNASDAYEGDFVFRNRDGRNMLGLMGWDARRFVAIATVADPAWDIVGIGDFDGDGESDLLWRHAGTGRNAIWRSGDAATQLRLAPVPDPAWTVATVGDFDGDRRSDILWRNRRTGANAIWRSGNALTSWGGARVADQHWQVAATGDINGDGRWDLVWRNDATGANVIWYSANAATRRVLPAVATRWSATM